MSVCKHISADGRGICTLHSSVCCKVPCHMGPCGDYVPATNGNRIRSMDNEQLAEFLCWLRTTGAPDCYGCPAYDFCKEGHTGFIDWLDEPFKEGQHEY